jgi:hypothetical protein
VKKQFSIKNYDNPTPKNWKVVADFGLLMIPVVQAFIGAAPEGALTPFQSWLIGGVVSVLAVGFKFFTKGLAESKTEE